MKNPLYLLVFIIFFSCGNEKVLHLPEIEHSDITELQDVSAAYLFYDETNKDSVELNRKNLISTTNWLVNVDKRLTLNQAIPYITFLQGKKKTSSHKNEKAKNYFTCNNLSKKNLGFIDFSDIIYNHSKRISKLKIDSLITNEDNFGLKKHENLKGIMEHMTIPIYLNFERNNIIYGKSFSFKEYNLLEKKDVKNYINAFFTFIQPLELEITLKFNGALTFQEYISNKQFIESLKGERIKVSHDEFITN